MELTPDVLQARKRRNLALAVVLGVFVVLVFAITIAKLRGGG